VDTGRFGTAQERPQVLRILERIECQDERRFAALDGSSQDLVQAGEPPRADHDGHALVPVESGDRRQRAALDLDDRNAKRRRVENQALERVPALRYDEQPPRIATCREGLLDGAAAGNDLVVGRDELGERDVGPLTRAEVSPPSRLLVSASPEWRPPGVAAVLEPIRATRRTAIEFRPTVSIRPAIEWRATVERWSAVEGWSPI
jgi:hypothetical protein